MRWSGSGGTTCIVKCTWPEGADHTTPGRCPDGMVCDFEHDGVGPNCIPPPAPADAAPDPAWQAVVMGDERWGALGCDSIGEPLTGVGHIERADPSKFKKPFTGEWLVLEDGGRWVLSYGHSSVFDALIGIEVTVRGHESPNAVRL